MKNKIRPAILISVGCLTLLIIAWVISRDSEQAPNVEPVSIESGQVDSIDVATPDSAETPVQEDEPVTGKEGGKEAANGHAKRIAYVPDNNLDRAEPEREFDFEFQESVKQMVESALTGDVEISISVGQFINRCGGMFQSEDQVLRYLQTKSPNLSAKTMFSFPNGESRRFENFEEYETYIWEKYDQCRVIRTVAEDDLHERITQLADNGHAIARYLYAMWRPITVPDPDTNNMLEWLEYQEKALAYTLQNMDEGEPLGLLAFGQSVRNINPGFFTPSHFQFTQAFFLASKKCGIESPWLDAQISEYRERLLNRSTVESKLEQIEINADELKELFCD